MNIITKKTVLLASIVGIALSSIAFAQPSMPPPIPPPTIEFPKLVGFGGSHTCNGTGASVTATISGGALGSSGTVTVKKGTLVWSKPFTVAPKATSTVAVPTTVTSCHASGYFAIVVKGSNGLSAQKWVEPGVVTYKEATGPI